MLSFATDAIPDGEMFLNGFQRCRSKRDFTTKIGHLSDLASWNDHMWPKPRVSFSNVGQIWRVSCGQLLAALHAFKICSFTCVLIVPQNILCIVSPSRVLLRWEDQDQVLMPWPAAFLSAFIQYDPSLSVSTCIRHMNRMTLEWVSCSYHIVAICRNMSQYVAICHNVNIVLYVLLLALGTVFQVLQIVVLSGPCRAGWGAVNSEAWSLGHLGCWWMLPKPWKIWRSKFLKSASEYVRIVLSCFILLWTVFLCSKVACHVASFVI